METLITSTTTTTTTTTTAATIISSTSTSRPSLPIFAIKLPKDSSSSFSRRRILRFSTPPKNNGNEPDLRSDSNHDTSLVPVLRNRTLSKDAAMGLVLSAANVRGWTTGSGMEGPPIPAESDSKSGMDRISTFPWSLFTKSPRRRMRVAFTCNVCGQRTTRAINPHAYTDGTVFVQCCGCNVFHKLVDNLNLFHEMKCYVNPSFNPNANADLGFKFFDFNDPNDEDFPLL
ncbi:hypothetical protein ACH5RR_035285 [Cinchona calisaya]|uniref:DNL-type domain-containing protein n=1 Tax=Cinchona calisaya TaxID=153742 RepID=A0ABD2YGK6_9GENT